MIKKSTMITKNTHKLEDLYDMEKKALGSGTYGVVTKCVHKISG